MKKGYLGLELTTTCIRYALVEKDGKGLEVEKTGVVPFKMNPNVQGEY